MQTLQYLNINQYQTINGNLYESIPISYQIYGQDIHTAPIILVNHALTGNSDLTSPEKGWWKEIVGKNKLIDTGKYTIICFNIPGNGYDNHLISKFKDFVPKDIANIFYKVLKQLNISNLYAIIGGSLGGGIAWEMSTLYPELSKYIIPIAADWKSTDWIIAMNAVQENILNNSSQPLQDARKMAMLFYRTPTSFTTKFNRTKHPSTNDYYVESWLNHHGNKLNQRYDKQSYLLMNHLLARIDISEKDQAIENTFSKIKSTIIQIAINSDLLFTAEENIKTKIILDQLNIKNQYHEIQSIHGHDAFLIEHQQITNFLSPIFN